MAHRPGLLLAACLMLPMGGTAFGGEEPIDGAGAPSRLIFADATKVPEATEDEAAPADLGLDGLDEFFGEPADEDLIGSDALVTDGGIARAVPLAAGEPELIQERYPNRAIKLEREVAQDAQGNYVNHGLWKMFDERGNLVAEGQYRNGERTGIWNRWYYRSNEAEILSKTPYQYFNAPFVSQASFENGKLHGKWTIYDSKQRKISEWEFAHGNRHGRSQWWYADGRMLRDMVYRDGEIDGELLEWGPDSRLLTKDAYEKGRKLAAKIEYYKGTQNKKLAGTYLYGRSTVETPDDWWNAKLAVYAKQDKGEKHGPWVSWYSTGQKQLEGEYRNDVQVGRFTWWYPNGQKAIEGSYDNGKQYGEWSWWHSNGQKSTQGEYADGNPIGRWLWWNEDGKVSESAELSHGVERVVELPPEGSDPQARPTIRQAPRQFKKR